MARLIVALVIVIALTLPTTGCTERPQPAAPIFGQAAPPQEKDGPVKPVITPGRWHATGLDKTGHAWEGYLIVDRAPERNMRAGYFEWQIQTGGGRYHFEGTFDPGSRSVHWVGYSVEERIGNAAMATYRATLSADGRRLENGTWSGGNSIPGTWSAEYVDD